MKIKRKPYQDTRLHPCPVCGEIPFVDMNTFTIYCPCGLRFKLNGRVMPEWHRMSFTADYWNESIAPLK